jgi:hypothetical protein
MHQLQAQREWQLASRFGNSGEQRFAIIGAVVAKPIDEKRRCAIDPTAHSTHEILADPIRIGILREGAGNFWPGNP